MPLEVLGDIVADFSDLSAVKGMPLKHIGFTYKPIQHTELLR
jgi:hypothetical protein